MSKGNFVQERAIIQLQVLGGTVFIYKVMEAHEYQGEYLAIPCEANPSYVVVSRSTTRSSAATAGTIQEKSGVSCDWYKTIVLIVLVLVGVVACAGLAVAVWSSTKVDSIDSRYVLILIPINV